MDISTRLLMCSHSVNFYDPDAGFLTSLMVTRVGRYCTDTGLCQQQATDFYWIPFESAHTNQPKSRAYVLQANLRREKRSTVLPANEKGHGNIVYLEHEGNLGWIYKYAWTWQKAFALNWIVSKIFSRFSARGSFIVLFFIIPDPSRVSSVERNL